MSTTQNAGQQARERMLSGLPVDERRLDLAGMSTAVLEGGDGPPMVLLHGPGEFAAGWFPVFPRLVRTHRVIAPDLPGHGASEMSGALDADRVLAWLGELIEQTCPVAPVLVGRVVGGAVAARYAVDEGGRLDRLVLVDTLGLAPFEPSPRFGLALHRYLAAPNRAEFERLMDLCAFDLDRARELMGERWEPLVGYAVERAGTPGVQAALGSLIGHFGAEPIPPEQLARIGVPTTLIWGRHDLATSLHVAEEASERYGWPLHVVEDAGDDPAFDRPEEFLEVLYATLRTPAAEQVAS